MKSSNPENPGGFSRNEIETMRLICKQYTNKEIASKLNRMVRTIDGYRETILLKTKARNTAGIVVYAIRKGIYKV